jgi:putative ABC transport system ATP-binding protein
MMGTLDTPDNGQIIIDGQDTSEIKHINVFRRSKIGFVFQLHNLIPTISARENIEMAMYGTGLSSETMKLKALSLLNMVDMEDLASQKPNILSGGERQRVAVARALANNPSIILADEPTGSLDTKNGELILNLLKHHQKELGATLIIVTHDPKIAQQTEESIEISDGKIDLGTD